MMIERAYLYHRLVFALHVYDLTKQDKMYFYVEMHILPWLTSSVADLITEYIVLILVRIAGRTA
jgi:hypothetical protein